MSVETYSKVHEHVTGALPRSGPTSPSSAIVRLQSFYAPEPRQWGYIDTCFDMMKAVKAIFEREGLTFAYLSRWLLEAAPGRRPTSSDSVSLALNGRSSRPERASSDSWPRLAS